MFETVELKGPAIERSAIVDFDRLSAGQGAAADNSGSQAEAGMTRAAA